MKPNEENFIHCDTDTGSQIEIAPRDDGGARITIGPAAGLSGDCLSACVDAQTVRDLANALPAFPEDYSTPPRLRRTLERCRLFAGVDASVSLAFPVSFVQLSSDKGGVLWFRRVYLRKAAARALAAYLRA